MFYLDRGPASPVLSLSSQLSLIPGIGYPFLTQGRLHCPSVVLQECAVVLCAVFYLPSAELTQVMAFLLFTVIIRGSP